MTKATKATIVHVGIIGFVALIFYILFIYPYPMYRAYPVGCHSLYRGEASEIESALVQHLSDSDNKTLPKLDELVAKGYYTFPKDRKFEGNYPEGIHDLRAKLLLGEDRHNLEDWKVIVTSTGKRCFKGKFLVVHGWHDMVEWVEEWPDE